MKIEDVNARFIEVMKIAILEEWKGISNKKQFAESLGLTPQAVSNIESQPIRNVTLDIIAKLTKVYDVNANYIISGRLPVLIFKNRSEDKLQKIAKILKEK